MKPWLNIALLVVAVALVCWPRHGLLARWKRGRALAARARREDVLKHILKCESSGRVPRLDNIAGTLGISASEAAGLLEELEDQGMVSYEEGRLRLKGPGREVALHIVRAHRLWESYLAEQTGVDEAEWHLRAERQEHLLTPQETERLAAQLGNPTRDPHGDAIPAPEGDLPAEDGLPLHAVAADTPVVITHIEDEPAAVYAQICAQGLRPGMRVFVIERTSTRIRFWADGNEHVLAPVLANNISVAPLPEIKASQLAEETFLSGLKPGQRARVAGLSAACRGPERRRLLDLGFVQGTEVEVEMTSPTGDPTAYRVRGTVVALRHEQAGLIRITAMEAAA
jgi:DtxR family transcriptional regulator, Mn-dependent transcriptional regulator